MFVHFRTLSLILVAAFTLSACADIIYSLGWGGDTTTPQQPVPVVQSEQKLLTKSYLPQRDEQPINTVHSQYDVFQAAQCLTQRIANDFNMPENFYRAVGYDDGAATVALVNPNTGKNGLYIDVVPSNNGSILLLYQNRATISSEWKKLPEKCR